MQMTAQDVFAPWLAVRQVSMADAVTGMVLALRGWRAKGRAIRRGRESGHRSEVLARFRVILERDTSAGAPRR
jgi:hypothetical protein